MRRVRKTGEKSVALNKPIPENAKFFDERNFHEVEAPLLIAHPPAESYLDVFETRLLDRYRNATPAYLSATLSNLAAL